MSVADGFITHMAATGTDTAAALSGDAVLRRRGKSTASNFKYGG
jgi:hypothetical protein